MSIEKVVIVSPRGFCAGVNRAVKVVEDCLEIYGKPLYVKHQIVHNKHVVQSFEQRGVITVESVDDIPDNATAIFSAHGSPPADYEQARKRGIRIIDATCPLVTRVHREVLKFSQQGYRIIYIGKPHHPEPIGVIGELPDQIALVSSVEDVGRLKLGDMEKAVYLTQTTLGTEEAEEIIQALHERYPNIIDPPTSDICYATINRREAVKKLARRVDLVLVIGSINSSNSNRLVSAASATGKPTYLIDDVDDLGDWFRNIKTVGISAGASAPEYLVQGVAHHFVRQGAELEYFEVTKEKRYFSEPSELRDAKAAANGTTL